MESSPWAPLETAGSLGGDGLQDILALPSEGLGVGSRSACNWLCDLGQVTSPGHVLASLSVTWGGGVGTQISGF